MSKLITSVREAAKLLDEENPGWYNKLNINKLNQAHGGNCILGQLYGEYQKGCEYLDLKISAGSAFGSFSSTDEWKYEITCRMNPKKHEGTFVWAMEQMMKGEKVTCEFFVDSWYWTVKDGEMVDKENRPIGTSFGERGDCAYFACKTWKVFKVLKFSDLKPGQKFAFADVQFRTLTRLANYQYIASDYLALTHIGNAEVVLKG